METAGVNSSFLNREESDSPTIIRLVFVGYAGGGTTSLRVRPELALSENAGWNSLFVLHTSNEGTPIATLLSIRRLVFQAAAL